MVHCMPVIAINQAPRRNLPLVAAALRASPSRLLAGGRCRWFFAVARERDLAAAADEQLVVACGRRHLFAAGCSATARRSRAASISIGAIGSMRYVSRSESALPMRSRSAARRRSQLRRREPQPVERHGERVALDDVAREFSRLSIDGQRGRAAAAELP